MAPPINPKTKKPYTKRSKKWKAWAKQEAEKEYEKEMAKAKVSKSQYDKPTAKKPVPAAVPKASHVGGTIDKKFKKELKLAALQKGGLTGMGKRKMDKLTASAPKKKKKKKKVTIKERKPIPPPPSIPAPEPPAEEKLAEVDPQEPQPKAARAGAGAGARRPPANLPSPEKKSQNIGPEDPRKSTASMSHMEEQYVKYGYDLGNFVPDAIIGTDHMASVYQSDAMTPDEYSMFFNWNLPDPRGGKQLMNRPKGIESRGFDETMRNANVLAEKERSFEFSRRHGDTVTDRIRQSDRHVNEGNFSNTFLCAY